MIGTIAIGGLFAVALMLGMSVIAANIFRYAPNIGQIVRQATDEPSPAKPEPRAVRVSSHPLSINRSKRHFDTGLRVNFARAPRQIRDVAA